MPKLVRVLLRSLVVLAAIWAFQTQLDVDPLAASEKRLCFKACKLFERACPETCDAICSGDPECVLSCLPDCHTFADVCRDDCKGTNVGIDSPDRNPTAAL